MNTEPDVRSTCALPVSYCDATEVSEHTPEVQDFILQSPMSVSTTPLVVE